jgi:hypothetical protein
MPVSVLVAGVSSASTNPNSYGSSSGFSSNSLDTNSYFQSSFGGYVKKTDCLFNNLLLFSRNRPSSPNLGRKQPAPLNPPTNSYGIREPPLPPTRPSPIPNSFGGNSSTLPPPMMPQ